MKISQMQIDEILDEAWEIRVRRGPELGTFVVMAVNEKNVVFDRDSGTDIGELVNELHSRL